MTGSRDPRAEVEAPVRRALDGLVVRSGIWFGAAVLAVVVTIDATSEPMHGFGHLVLPGLLFMVLAMRGLHLLFRSERIRTDDAWARVREIAPRDTELAGFLTFTVPFAWFVGGAAIVMRHVGHHDLATLVSVWAPLGVALWFVTTLAWIHDCRERLARALLESDRRFRLYWERLPSSA